MSKYRQLIESKKYTFVDTSFDQLMKRRIYKVLLVCNTYDAFMLEEDGRIDERIFNEYFSLNLRYPPVFIQAHSVLQAFKILEDDAIDLIITMLTVEDINAFKLARRVKDIYPNKPIVVTHRSDGSGTSFIFTDYLSKVSKNWSSKVGTGTSVNWPVGLGGKGNDGVAGLVKQTEGSIGYVELAYAVQNKILYANMKNKAGNFVEATFQSVSAAAEGAAKNMPADLRVSITDAAGKDSYPISGFTWLLIYKNMKNEAKAKALVNFLKWAETKGQAYATDLFYAPLPKAVVKLCEKNISSITVNGQKIK